MKNCPVCNASYPDQYTLCPHDGGRLQADGRWNTGSIVREKYRIMGPIGAGGMATVYQAEHIHFREIRALKVISSELSKDEGFVRRFMQEAVLTRRLQHPNAVRVDDIDKAEDGRPFIVMEFIDGVALKDAMTPQVPMPTEEACRLAKQVGLALEAAHKLGMVHRDIKPANIFLANASEGRQAKVLDFGIATVKESQFGDTRLGSMTLTGKGMVIGTPAYMSPEQAAGKLGSELDGRSDLYSLGVVMYQMLSGDLPLYADSELQLLMAHLVTEPMPILQRAPGLPPVIADLVMRCLAKDPDYRPANATEFVKVLEAFEKQPLAEPTEIMPVIAPTPAVNTAPTAPRQPASPMVEYATLHGKARGSFFTANKMAVAAVLFLCALSVGALGLWSKMHNQAAASTPAVVATPPTITPAPAPVKTDTTAAAPSPDTTTADAQPGPDAQPSEPPPSDDTSASSTAPAVAAAPMKTPRPASKPVQSATTPTSLNEWGKFPEPQGSANQTEASPPQAATPAPFDPSANSSGDMNSADTSGTPARVPQASFPANGGDGGQVYRTGSQVLGPVIIQRVEPRYTHEAKAARYSGTTMLSVVVDEMGIPQNIQVIRPAGFGLDQQAIQAVQQWRFRPGFRNGAPVRVQINIAVNFRFAGLFSFARSTVFH